MAVVRAYCSKAFFPGFFVLFYLSGIYQIPFADVSAVSIAQAKHLGFGLMMLVMAAGIDWQRVRLDPFGRACLVWVLLHVVHFITWMEPVGIYIQRLGQVAFIWLLVTRVVQSGVNGLSNLSRWYSVWMVALVFAMASGAAFLSDVTISLSNGFGNNRVNFSIWLSQFVFLSLFVISASAHSRREMARRTIVLVTPVLVLQVFSGGRTGLLASSLTVLWFALRYAGVRGGGAALLYLGLVVSFAAEVSPTADLVAGTHVFRSIGLDEGGWFAWLDRLSSYRIGIAVSALATLDVKGWLLGVGVENFKGWAIGAYWQVHNIYIRTLGEFGVVGLAALAYLLFSPFVRLRAAAWRDPRLAYCGVCLTVGMLHPDFLVTAIGTCMIYWLCFASLVGDASLRLRQDGTPGQRPTETR